MTRPDDAGMAQILVADVGGTNARLALADPVSGALRAIEGFRNDDFADFSQVLRAYVAAVAPGRLAGCAVAIGGPVIGATARLTNRDWRFETTAIAQTLSDIGCGPVWLLNDLAALGHALDALHATQTMVLRPGSRTRQGNGQRLVVGAGTGFNACLVKSTAPATLVMEAEVGHASLPGPLRRAIDAALGAEADAFGSIEDVISGRGLRALHSARTGAPDTDPARIFSAAAAGPGPEADTVALHADLFGTLIAELSLLYMPLDGIWFAGSVARAQLSDANSARVIAALTKAETGIIHDAHVPLALIVDDRAPLTGVARFAGAQLARA
jgi:glucokinase